MAHHGPKSTPFGCFEERKPRYSFLGAAGPGFGAAGESRSRSERVPVNWLRTQAGLREDPSPGEWERDQGLMPGARG